MVHTKNFYNADATDPNVDNTDNGGFFSDISLNDLLKMGSKTYSDTLKSQTDAANAAAAVQLEKLKLQKIQADALATSSNSSAVVSKIKSYALPIAVIGVVVIGGISAYFYFKKKKA
jgi:hypothetical protein